MEINGSTESFGLDQSFTDQVKASVGPKCEPRLRQLYNGLVQHLHDYVRENEVTLKEFVMGTEMIPKMVFKFPYADSPVAKSEQGDANNNMIMDLFGLEPLCDEISHKKVESAIGADSTAANDLGPFWRPNAPRYPMGASVVQTPDNLNWQGRHTNYHGRVLNAATGQPIESAELDVWQAAPNGLYDVQDPSQPDMNLRGRFTTGKDGEYSFYALRPTAYSAPSEGPWADMLKQLDRHFMRSAHVHFVLKAPGYRPIITQLYDRACEYVGNDVAFLVKDSLLIDFKPVENNPKTDLEVAYNFKLVDANAAETTETPKGML